MWGEWLVYGTALGVGDAVVRALRVLDIDLPEARYMRAMPVYFYPFVVASTRKVSSSGGRAAGSFGGGGFGAGGGFGGVNYIVGGLAALGFYAQAGSQPVSAAAATYGAVNGTAYFVAFFFVLSTMRWRGAALATVVTRLSIVVPVIVAFFVWQERPSMVQAAGISLACVSLTLVGRGKLETSVTRLPWYAPLHAGLLFLIGGSSRLSQEAFRHTGSADQVAAFLLVGFGIAAAASVVMLLIRRRAPDRADLALGAVIGTANVSQTFFVLKALEVNPGYVVFPIAGAGGLVLTALVAVAFLAERLTLRSYMGIGFAALALVLLQIDG